MSICDAVKWRQTPWSHSHIGKIIYDCKSLYSMEIFLPLMFFGGRAFFKVFNVLRALKVAFFWKLWFLTFRKMHIHAACKHRKSPKNRPCNLLIIRYLKGVFQKSLFYLPKEPLLIGERGSFATWKWHFRFLSVRRMWFRGAKVNVYASQTLISDTLRWRSRSCIIFASQMLIFNGVGLQIRHNWNAVLMGRSVWAGMSWAGFAIQLPWISGFAIRNTLYLPFFRITDAYIRWCRIANPPQLKSATTEGFLSPASLPGLWRKKSCLQGLQAAFSY